MILVPGRGYLTKKSWALEVLTSLLSYRSENRDHNNSLGSNKSGSPQALFLKIEINVA